MLESGWFKIYCAVGIIESLFNGVYAGTIWFRAPKLDVAAKGIDRKAWGEAWTDLFSHPTFFHQAWFNFCGAAMGWASGGYLWWRIANQPSRFSWVEAGLSLTAGLGICGYLPNVLNSIAGAIREVGKLLVSLLSRLTGSS